MSLQPPSPSRSTSSVSSYDQYSVHSFLSSSEHTAFSDDKHRGSSYIDHVAFKSLPVVPDDHSIHDPYVLLQTPFHNPQPQTPSRPHIHPLTSITQLAAALGPDNTPHSTEIATIPCAGIRIPHGPLSGLIAWRLVVTLPLPVKGKRGWWNEMPSAAKKRRRNSSIPNFPFASGHSYSQSDALGPPQPTWATTSAVSLPLTTPPLQIHSTDNFHPPQSALSRSSHVQSASRNYSRPPHLSNTTVVSNFILDTSLPYSIISRDTLVELGYPSHKFPLPHLSNPHSDQWQDDRNSDAIVTLSIQNIPTRLRIARPGEASRLGVQFLQDAGVSVFFPRDGEAVGPVLYLESSYLLKDVPRTITSLAAGARALHAPRLSLPQRVRALFGLA